MVHALFPGPSRMMPIKMETVAAAPTTTSDLPEIKSEIKVEDFCNSNADGSNNVAQQQQQQQQTVVSTEHQMHQAQNNCNWVGHSAYSFSTLFITSSELLLIPW